MKRHSTQKTKSAWISGGFTLIEVMVVVLIIGILVNYVVVSIGSSSPSDALKTEARRFFTLVDLAAEEALLRSNIIGALVEAERYEFLILQEKTWKPLEESIFRKRSLPEEISFDLMTDEPIRREKQKKTPDIVFFTSGEITPFEIKISSEITEDYFLLKGTEIGELSLDHVSEP